MGITLLVLLVAYYSLIPLFSSKFAQFHLQVTENQCLDEKEKVFLLNINSVNKGHYIYIYIYVYNIYIGEEKQRRRRDI